MINVKYTSVTFLPGKVPYTVTGIDMCDMPRGNIQCPLDLLPSWDYSSANAPFPGEHIREPDGELIWGGALILPAVIASCTRKSKSIMSGQRMRFSIDPGGKTLVIL